MAIHVFKKFENLNCLTKGTTANKITSSACRMGAKVLKLTCKGGGVFNGATRLHFEGDSFANERFHKDLHASEESQDEVKSGLFLNVVVREYAAVFELFSGEDKTLLF